MEENNEFMTQKELQKMCSEKKLDKKLMKIRDFEEQFKNIEKCAQSLGKKVDAETVQSYLSELGGNSDTKSNESNESSTLQIHFDEAPKNEGVLNFSDIGVYTESSKEDKISNTNKTQKSPKSGKSKKETLQIKDNQKEKIHQTVIEDKPAVLIEIPQATHQEELATHRYEYEDKLKSLEEQIEKLNNIIARYKKDNSPDTGYTNKDFYSIVPELNQLLNGSNEKVTVQINKELLSKATKFIDSHSLIRLEDIVRQGSDLNSTIVQSILLAFINQNSLI